jgi:hypothetical protein
MHINPFSMSYFLKILLSLALLVLDTGALICDYLLDYARNQHEFFIMNGQDGHFQFDTKQNNLRSYAHGQVCLEQF